MDAATWEQCRQEFTCDDGAFVDLQVPGTADQDWELLWSALRSGRFELSAYRDGESIALPESAEWALAEQQRAAVLVSVRLGSVTANCHFVGGDLELDIDPREVISEVEFESVLTIMRFVAAAVRRPMVAVSEGGTVAEAFLKVFPDGRAVFLPRDR